MCISIFMHIHYVNGVAVVHTHPMCHNHGHSHSQADYFALGEYTTFSSILNEVNVLSPTLYEVEFLYSTVFNQFVKTLYILNISLRAPPVSLV